jgi:hypothetical protein
MTAAPSGAYTRTTTHPPELRWFWSITVFVGSRPSIATNGRAVTFTEAKEQFASNWRKIAGRLQ